MTPFNQQMMGQLGSLMGSADRRNQAIDQNFQAFANRRRQMPQRHSNFGGYDKRAIAADPQGFQRHLQQKQAHDQQMQQMGGMGGLMGLMQAMNRAAPQMGGLGGMLGGMGRGGPQMGGLGGLLGGMNQGRPQNHLWQSQAPQLGSLMGMLGGGFF